MEDEDEGDETIADVDEAIDEIETDTAEPIHMNAWWNAPWGHPSTTRVAR